MAALIDSVSDITTTIEQQDRAPETSEVGDWVEMASDAYAPVSLFAGSRVDVVEELAFRALFALAFVVTVYGVVAAF